MLNVILKVLWIWFVYYNYCSN